MQFKTWIESKETEGQESYSSYHDLLELAWNEGRNQALEDLAVEAENEQEPSTVAAYYRRLKETKK